MNKYYCLDCHRESYSATEQEHLRIKRCLYMGCNAKEERIIPIREVSDLEAVCMAHNKV
jgi:hypothetical protein